MQWLVKLFKKRLSLLKIRTTGSLLEFYHYYLNPKFGFNPFSASPPKWSNTLKRRQLANKFKSVFDHFVGLALKGLIKIISILLYEAKILVIPSKIPRSAYLKVALHLRKACNFIFLKLKHLQKIWIKKKSQNYV